MLNTDAYVVLAGNPEKWDTELVTRVDAGESLVDVQVDQFERGKRDARLSKSIYGWYVRAGNNLQEPSIIARVKERGGELDGSKEAAIAAGIAWANEDPENREFFAYRKDVEGQ